MCSRLKSSTQVIKDTGFTLQVALLHVTLVHPRIDNKDMEFAFTEEQEAFRDSVKRFTEEKSTSEDVRRLMETEEGYDEATWDILSTELAVTGLIIPEEFGGSGFGATELGIVMEQFGRSLICVPFFSSSVMAASALILNGSENDKNKWLPAIAAGGAKGTLCVSERSGSWDESAIQTTASKNGDQYLLNGEKHFVLDAHVSDFLIVVSRLDNRTALFTLDPKDDRVQIKLEQGMDQTRKICTVTMKGAPAEILGPDKPAALDKIFDRSIVALSHEMIGGAQQLLDSAIEYTKLRVQFGRSISSFQAIKHRLADLLLEVELAKSACYHAAYEIDKQQNSSEAASHAKAQASEAYLNSAIQCIQLHGGVGFTWENDTHLWFKRAKSSEVFLGSPHEHRERMLRASGI